MGGSQNSRSQVNDFASTESKRSLLIYLENLSLLTSLMNIRNELSLVKLSEIGEIQDTWIDWLNTLRYATQVCKHSYSLIF